MKPLPLLDQRKIEAGVLIPVIRAFQQEIGAERANEIVRDVITNIARNAGLKIGSAGAESPIEKVASLMPRFNEGGALELDVIEESETRYSFNVTRCRFAEYYKELGVPELGFLLSCNRDFALSEGIGDGLELRRTQTIMEGASHCDFRFHLENETKGEVGNETAEDDRRGDTA